MTYYKKCQIVCNILLIIIKNNNDNINYHKTNSNIMRATMNVMVMYLKLVPN